MSLMGSSKPLAPTTHCTSLITFRERIVLPLWRSIASCNLMLPKEERRAMLLRLYNDESALIDHSQEQKKPKPESSKSESKAPAKSEPNDQRQANGDDVRVEGPGANTSSEDE